MTPEFDPIAAYKACAPLHWDAEEWDFQAWSEDDESLTDGEDLQFLLGRELDEDDDDDMSWEGNFSSSEEETVGTSTEEESAVGGFLCGGSLEDDEDDDDEETEGSSGHNGDSGGDNGSDNDGSNDDSDASVAPLIKRRKVLGTHWW
jgi:hypothetical protein